MKKTERALLILLRAGLWMRDPDDKELICQDSDCKDTNCKNSGCKEVFSLTEDEWAEVFKLSKEQTVSALVLQGINRLNEEQMPTLSLLRQWAVNVDRTVRNNQKQNKVQEEVVEWLKSQGIQPKVLKGQGVASLYNEPSQRVCGDIDIFFPIPGDYKRVLKAARKKGLNPKKSIYGAFVFKWNGVTVECHKRLLDISNPFCKSAMTYLAKREAKTEGIYPTQLTTLLLLNTHILKHLLGNGIGLRQFTDMARAYHRLNGQYDKAEYFDWCKRLKIYNWTQEMNGFLVDQLGLSPKDLPSHNLDAPQSRQANNDQHTFIYSKVMSGGNFGYYGPRREIKNAPRFIKRICTLVTILRSWKYSLRLAPYESFFIIYQLSKGNK